MSGGTETWPDVAGFSVRGYRSFDTNTAWVAPLSKVTCLIGPNNSGKSNVLRAVAHAFPSMTNGRTVIGDLKPLDFPRGTSDRVVEVGQAFDYGPDPVAGVLDRIGAKGNVNGERRDWELTIRPIIEALEQAPGRSVERGDSRLLWRRGAMSPQGWTGTLDEDVNRAFSAVPPDRRHLLRQMSSALTGTSGGAETDDVKRIIEWCLPFALPTVESIPSLRSIHQPDGYEASEYASTDGTGLPLFLQRLQSPEAESWDQEREKLSRINEFLSGVIERPVELRVPHNNTGVYVEMGGQVLPLEHLGSGISQLVLMATLATMWENRFVCVEEPEVNLHPLLLRALITYLRDHTSNQYLIATHSSHVLNDPQVTVLRIDHQANEGSTVVPAITSDERHAVAHNLGYRASDLLQANSIIWVEGPSDRVYVKEWLSLVDDTLVEDVHYTIMFYGGRLLARLSGEDTPKEAVSDRALDDFIRLPSINRHMAILIDSDKRNSSERINATKRRIKREFEDRAAFVWITAGREIENYVPFTALLDSVPTTHRKAIAQQDPDDRYADRFEGVTKKDKMAIAEAVIAQEPDWAPDVLERARDLARFIQDANRGVQAAVQV